MKQLQRISGFDYFMVCLSEAYAGRKLIYNKIGWILKLEDIANLPFGEVKKMMDEGWFCEMVEKKYNRNAYLDKRIGIVD